MIGPLVAEGRTSTVFEYGDDAVVKVLRPWVPDHWAEVEARLTRAVHALGVPAPEVAEVITVEDRPAIVVERVVGPSMWRLLLERPERTEELTEEFADIQRRIHRAGLPEQMPSVVDRVCGKLATVDVVDPAERDAAIELVRSRPVGAALLHGDMHPGNVLVGTGGSVVIDWFDAAIGHPVADVARSLFLLGDSGANVRHLPGADDQLLGRVRRAYRRAMQEVIEPDHTEAVTWGGLVALSRVAEGTGDPDDFLVECWRAASGVAGVS